MATIEKIYLKKDNIWEQEKQIDLNASGLKADKRNVSFISSEGDNRLSNDRMKGFCHMKFKANFVVGGIDISSLTEGGLLQVGDAVVKITEIGKECFDDCPIVKKFDTLCFVNEQIFFGEILEAGVVKEKDSVLFI